MLWQQSNNNKNKMWTFNSWIEMIYRSLSWVSTKPNGGCKPLERRKHRKESHRLNQVSYCLQSNIILKEDHHCKRDELFNVLGFCYGVLCLWMLNECCLLTMSKGPYKDTKIFLFLSNLPNEVVIIKQVYRSLYSL